MTNILVVKDSLSINNILNRQWKVPRDLIEVTEDIQKLLRDFKHTNKIHIQRGKSISGLYYQYC